MTVKKVKEEKTINKTKKEFSAGRYFYAVGKRKTAVAQVKIYPVEKNEKDIVVNGKKINEYFTVSQLQSVVKSPLITIGREGKFDIDIKVSGGGKSGQADAARLGISRALVEFEGDLRKILKSVGFLKRDSRVVERKKPGLKKARRSPQWAKR